MNTESSAPLSSPSPPSSQESSATISREMLEPEEYETASEPEMDGSDAVPVLEKTLASFPGSEHGDTVDESFDKAVLGENSQEKMEEENLDLWQHNQLGNIGSVSDDVLDGVQNGAGEIPVEVNENVGGEIENSNNFDTGISQELEPDESGKDDSNDSAMEPKAIETGGNRVTDSFSYSSINQSDFEEVKPKGSEVEFSVALTEEVKPDTERRITSNEEKTEETEEKEDKEDEEKTLKTDDSLLADDHVLEHRNIDLEEPTFVEAETKEIFVDASERADAGDESEAEQKSAKQEEADVMNEAESEASVASSILLNAETPEFNLFCSSNDEASERGEGLVECPALMESKPVKIAVNKFDQVNGIEVSDDEALSDSEHVSSCGVSELLTTEGDALKSTIEEEIHPISANETVIGEENTLGTTTESHRSIDDKLDQSIASEVSEKISSLNQEFTDEKVVIGSGHASSLSEIDLAHKLNANDDDMKTDAATLSDNARENVVGDSETSFECLPQASVLDRKVKPDDDDDDCHVGATEVEKNQGNENEVNRISDGPSMVSILDSPEVAKQIIKEMERINSSSQSNIQATRDYLRNADGQIVSDSDDVLDSDEDGEAGELFDSAALAALLKAATGSSDGTVTVTAQDAARIFSVDRPAGLGTAPSLRPAAPRSTRPNLFSPAELTAAVSEPSTSMSDDEKKLHEKVEQIMVKFLRLVYRLGHSPEDAVAAQVLYRLNLAEGIRQGRQVSRSFNIENAKKQALQLEEGKNDLEFSCNILVFGKTGVGKSATINSIFGEKKSSTNPFQPATTSVREISGVIDGVKIRVIDTPGLKSSIMDQATNRKILLSIKKFTKNCPPDIVLYVDRMDTQTHDFNDLPLLRSITSILGSSIWFNAIVAFTHAASAPPDGPSGAPLTYDVFVAQRSHVVQQTIRQAAGDMRLLNPVALVENHPSCRRNREGERVLPNGVSWRTQLLLLSFSSKILSEANSLLKLQDSSPGKLFGFRLRPPPLPFLLSSILQSRAHPKLSGDQGGDAADSDVELDDFSDTERDEDDDEYDQLPPFKPLKKAQIANLTKEQRKAYFDEYDYRAKLLQKKQWKEELRRLKEIKKNGKDSMNDNFTGDMPEDYDQDGAPAAVQVPLPDMVLPPSFDCDNPAYRYRFLEPTSQLLTRPVLDTHGWDHDCGYDGVSIEESLAIAGHFPTSMAVQITKDKKEFNIHLDSSIAAKHGENGSTLAGFDIQTVGKQLAYVLRGETKVKNLKRNKTAAGVSITFLGGTVATGLKVEDRILISKRLGLVASTGAVRAQGDVAFGANLEARLRDKDYPFGQALSTLGLSLMKWRNDLALGANLQSQFSVGRNSKMAVRAGLNNKLTGQITVRTSTTEQFQIALAGIVPLAIFIYRSIRPNESYFDH